MTATAPLLAVLVLSADVRVQESDGRFVFTADGAELAVYHAAPAKPPEGVDAMYARSGFVHPVRTPSGRVVTDDFSPDYSHQNGLFNTWTKATFRDRPVDFWNRHKGLGTYRHAAVLEVGQGRGRGHLKVEIEHATLDPEVVVLREERTYDISVADGVTVIDVHSVQRAVGDPLVCEKHLYGGFAVRGARGWSGPATMLTSGGLDRMSGNHSRAEWVAMSGPTDQGPATVVVISSPQNFRSPQSVRLHPEQPYFCFAPCVTAPFTIERGRPLESRYRVLAYDGSADADRIQKLNLHGER